MYTSFFCCVCHLGQGCFVGFQELGKRSDPGYLFVDQRNFHFQFTYPVNA
jgi:hypothetical protein